jgi:DNA-binding IclR family transcriptional regulator
MSADVGSNQSVERALSVLRTFTAGRSELRMSDVAKAAGLGMSTASRLLATLEAAGFVERDPVNGLYRLGLDMVSLGGSVLNNHPVHKVARQIAQNLAAEIGLGANLAVRRGDRLFYLLNFEGRQAPRSFVLAGQTNPLHATGLGKSLLSGLAAPQRRELLAEAALVAYTPRTLTSHDALDTAIDLTIARGYATEVEELALGRACVAAPIRDASGEVVAALSVSGALSVIDLAGREQLLARAVIEAADQVSIGLGYVGPAHLPASLEVAG